MANWVGTPMAVTRKRELLEKEGISFTDEIISDFKEVRVYPQISKTVVRKS